MLNNLEKQIKEQAHFAAQTVITNYCTDNLYGISEAQKRTKILDMLEENGFGRFLLCKNVNNYLELSSYSYNYLNNDQCDSWSAYLKFSVKEVIAYLKFLGYVMVENNALYYIRENFGTQYCFGGPGRAFNTGWSYHLSTSGKRIIGYISGGLDI